MALPTVEKGHIREWQMEHMQIHRTKRDTSGVEGAALQSLWGRGDQTSPLVTWKKTTDKYA